MPSFIAERAKAFVGLIIAGLVPLILSAIQTSFGFTIPSDWVIAITAALTGIFVHQVPNKAPSQ